MHSLVALQLADVTRPAGRSAINLLTSDEALWSGILNIATFAQPFEERLHSGLRTQKADTKFAGSRPLCSCEY